MVTATLVLCRGKRKGSTRETKDIAGSDIMKLKVSWWVYPLWALKS